MKHFKTLAGLAVAIAGALSLGPLSAEILRRWMERNGYLDHPEEGFAWAVSVLASLATRPWVQLAVIVAAVFAAFYILGYAIGIYQLRRDARRSALSKEMVRLAASIRRSQGGFRSEWSDNIRDIRPFVESTFLKMTKEGLYSPPNSIFDRADGAKLLSDHFEFVGVYISEGHWKVAKRRALELKPKLDD
jgi:hypothetical protein